MHSVWSDTVIFPEFPQLQKDAKTHVLIIGGGIAGILCAHMLEASGIDYMLVEADRICSGITKNTTAKITCQHGVIYADLTRKFGHEQAKMYLNANRSAFKEYERLSKDIDCDFTYKDSFVYSMHDPKLFLEELVALSDLGISVDYVDKLPLPFSVTGSLKWSNQAQFHPLKFLSAISGKLKIYEKTKVKELIQTNRKTVANTNHGKITADKIIIATHFPFLNKHGSYFIKLYQSRSYVIALENAKNVNGMFVDEREKGMSFRNYTYRNKDLLLIGGGDHRTGKKGGNWTELRAFADKYFFNAKEKFHWATQDCMTLDGVPYIGQYSKNTPNLFVATGFNKWGMTSSMAAAMILRDLILEKENPYAPVFSPSRTIWRPQLFVNALESTSNLLLPKTKRCPHLGCALKWNPAEHSWDCPCHGSRFTKDGRLIDNPATGNLSDK